MQYREYQTDDIPPNQAASELASPWMRLIAVIIDILIYAGVSIIAAIVGLLLFPDDTVFRSDDMGTEANVGFIILVVGAAIITLIVQWVLLGTRGQTIGKIAMKIRIVDAQTGAHPG
ncbi:MAG: RDD family protein, partial [Dehalococcoidia bacterium]|nr:RDD family protein [Dehalococcoidia bacterium]